ncbi:hypothetical protein [Nocardia farcinica]|uniref:hypothetical protein n=1 Tax=Nocardia farcinica TaxID=37329 RepID=UPI0018956C22|nr:hypothetical protein [Nocardia farcinica]MBF6235112.1 hypothetical protein [Nocardia farcinica]
MSEQSKEPVTPEDAAPQAEVAAPPTEAQAADGAEQERAPDDGATRPPSLVTALAVAALVAALAAALWFGVGWARAAFVDGARADARDSALDAARQAAINMTSMNIDDVPGSLALARSSMTGAILESAEKNRAQSEQMATQAGVGMSAKVLGAALTELTGERDHATALVVLQVTETKPDRAPSDYRYTWSLSMAKDGEVWKAEQVASLSQPVLLSGPGPQDQPGAQEQPGADEPGQPAPTEPAQEGNR